MLREVNVWTLGKFHKCYELYFNIMYGISLCTCVYFDCHYKYHDVYTVSLFADYYIKIKREKYRTIWWSCNTFEEYYKD